MSFGLIKSKETSSLRPEKKGITVIFSHSYLTLYEAIGKACIFSIFIVYELFSIYLYNLSIYLFNYLVSCHKDSQFFLAIQKHSLQLVISGLQLRVLIFCVFVFVSQLFKFGSFIVQLLFIFRLFEKKS